MKWLLKLFRREKEAGSGSRIYSVESAGRSAAKTRKVSQEIRNVPEPDPIFSDTGNLAISDENLDDEANPYETASWELDQEKGLRRVGDDKTVTPDRGKADETNPYNTGAFRRGW